MTLHTTETREARFTRVYEQHHETVRRYIWRRDPGIVDDVVAETFLVAWRRLDEIPEQAAPWLIGVARNVRRNEHRGARRRQAVSVRLADAVPALAGVDAPREAAAVEAALRTLTPRDREVLLLAVWDGLDRTAIAAALGCSKANASLRLHRARRRLAAALRTIDADSNRGLAFADSRRSG
ncbi:MAG TPA: sigma-70 family RNA polymerase sigma factor [Gaiellales bacterium]|jgi:RNA polymerase sigma-70 factor (ECF subfamily)